MGNNAIYLETNNLMPIIEIWTNESPAVMVSRSISGMILGEWILPLVGVFCLVFMATTFDSGAYTLASSATKKMEAGKDPDAWNRIFWAFFIALLPFALLIGVTDSPDLQGIDKLKPFQTITCDSRTFSRRLVSRAATASYPPQSPKSSSTKKQNVFGCFRLICEFENCFHEFFF